MQPAEEFWRGFGQDPRDPAVSGLRTSDVDRDHAQTLITDAYAEGRLDQTEFDDRCRDLHSSRTYGELVDLVKDLVPVHPKPAGDLVSATPSDVQKMAETAFKNELKDAWRGFVVPSLITTMIWFAFMFGGFFWPAFVIGISGAHLIHVHSRRDEIVARNRQRIERRQAKELKRRPRRGPAD